MGINYQGKFKMNDLNIEQFTIELSKVLLSMMEIMGLDPANYNLFESLSGSYTVKNTSNALTFNGKTMNEFMNILNPVISNVGINNNNKITIPWVYTSTKMTLLVFVNGVYAIPNTYLINNNVITFSENKTGTITIVKFQKEV